MFNVDGNIERRSFEAIIPALLKHLSFSTEEGGGERYFCESVFILGHLVAVVSFQNSFNEEYNLLRLLRNQFTS